MGVRGASPLKMGLISLENHVSFMYRHSFDVSFMYLKCISSVVFGAFGRLVSLCIVYVSSCMVMYRFLCLVPSFATVFNLYRYMRLYRLSSILDDTVSNTCVIMYHNRGGEGDADAHGAGSADARSALPGLAAPWDDAALSPRERGAVHQRGQVRLLPPSPSSRARAWSS